MRRFSSPDFVGHRPDKNASMGQAQYRSSCSALPNESLVEPAALEAGATLVVEVAVEAILVEGVAAKVAVAVLEEVVEEARVGLERERVVLEPGVDAVRVDGAQVRWVSEAKRFFLLLERK